MTAQFSTPPSLADLPIGACAVVGTIEAHGLSRRRLLDLGLVPGTVVYAIRRSPAGDPTAFLVRGSVIALRADTARQITISEIH